MNDTNQLNNEHEYWNNDIETDQARRLQQAWKPCEILLALFQKAAKNGGVVTHVLRGLETWGTGALDFTFG